MSLWRETFERLSAEHGAGGIEAEDLERLAVAAYMIGDDTACERAWIAAHQDWLGRGEVERAASCAFRHALGLFFRGDLAPATGWVARGGRLLERGRPESIERVWFRMLTDLPRLFDGDPEAASTFLEAEVAAERAGDTDALAFARIGRGYSLVQEGRAREGMRLLDEVMVAVTAGDVSPVLAGIAYCQLITLCRTVFDLRRAREWTEALTRWCDAQPGIVPFRGNCLVHRCEMFQLRGAWDDAEESARRACTWLAGPPVWDSLGAAHYQLAEIQRLRGNWAEAEASYHRASLAGREPQPGMSLLFLAQGQLELAVPAIRRAVSEAQGRSARSHLLPAYVEIMLEAGDLSSARDAADELADIAVELGALFLRGLAAEARGAVMLAEEDPGSSVPHLRSAQETWQALEAPYRAARTRLLIAMACRRLGDQASADLELRAARDALERLGAQPDLERLGRLVNSREASGPLSSREVEVLTLLSTGMTNRAIAAALFISEKTVARHISNIFTKLGLSSRAEATAYAFKHKLVS